MLDVSKHLYRTPQLPHTRSRPGVWASVFLAHVVLLWLVNLNWPLQKSVQKVVVQIFHNNSATAQGLNKSSGAAAGPDENASLSTNPVQRGIGIARARPTKTPLSA